MEDEKYGLEGIDDRFLIFGQMEILDALHELAYGNEPVHVYPGDADDAFMTTLLDARIGQLVFAVTTDAQSHARLRAAGRCRMVAFPAGVRVQFAGIAPRLIDWGDSIAYAVEPPRRIARIERKEFFRVALPATTQLPVRLEGADGRLLGQWALHDLSIGGISLRLPDHAADAIAQVAQVRFALPGYGDIVSAAALRHASEPADAGADAGRRAGLAFVDLPVDARARIQRYITAVEYERRSRAGDIGEQGE